jgi:hypothetical protein
MHKAGGGLDGAICLFFIVMVIIAIWAIKKSL